MRDETERVEVGGACGGRDRPHARAEHGDPRYILDLVRRIVTVSLETMGIVRSLPELHEAE